MFDVNCKAVSKFRGRSKVVLRSGSGKMAAVVQKADKAKAVGETAAAANSLVHVNFNLQFKRCDSILFIIALKMLKHCD